MKAKTIRMNWMLENCVATRCFRRNHVEEVSRLILLNSIEFRDVDHGLDNFTNWWCWKLEAKGLKEKERR